VTYRTTTVFRLALVFLVLAVGASVWFAGRPFVFPLDDAYITLHNAFVLQTGSDPSYAASPLTGATSLVHLALVRLALTVGSPVAGAYVVAILGAVAYALGLASLAIRHGLNLLAATGVVLMGLATGYAPFQQLNGLETGWAMAAVVWSFALASAPTPGRLLPLLCGLLPFVRPELAALSAALMLRQAWLRWSLGMRRAIVGDALLVLVAAMPWLFWSWTQTGALIPATASTKQAFFAQSGMPLPTRAWVVAEALASALGPPALVALIALPRSTLASVAWAFTAALAVAFTLTFPGGLHQNCFRYAYPLLPVCVWALCTIATSARRRLFWPLLGVCVVWGLLGIPPTLQAFREGSSLTRDGLQAGAWMQANLPHNAVVLVHDAGAPAWATRLKLVDVVGLKTPSSAASHRRWTAPSHGSARGRAVDEIATRAGATHAVVLQQSFWSSVGDGLRAQGWQLTLLRKSPLAEGYNVYALKPPYRTEVISTSPPATVATSPAVLPSSARAKGET
jgi:hypothetical protein